MQEVAVCVQEAACASCCNQHKLLTDLCPIAVQMLVAQNSQPREKVASGSTKAVAEEESKG